MADRLGRHLPALGQCGLKVRLDLGNTVRSAQIGGAFKVVVEAAVVQINGTHHSFPVVADKYLGVDEARRVLVDFDA